ncbi:MAG: UvrD-helicase domain-containing protein, partial [Bacteroidales bacterium]|nr:UvrD-helicase domain-containing protein [Bacteroidales bacterium]
MGSVKIIKASAGSGKTHTLASEYLSLLLPESGIQDPQAYKHILAVTFTNKATREMKERILEQLYEKSRSGGKDSVRAREMLIAILHDYSQFSVSTIDRFFQMVMRSFAREIGQYASYGVELDTQAVLHQAVDGIFESLDEPGNENLLEWLLRYSMEEVDEGGKWDVSGNLKEIAKLFMNENFRLMRRDLGQPFGDRESLALLDARLREIAGNSNLDSRVVNTASLMRSELYRLGIFSDLYRQLNSYLRDNNLVLLSESNEILNRIIDGSDTPFIYEKVGLRFDHFMLDEFQDTSRMQWMNFLPLLRESLARGNDSLIVGDIKQSIYRWRNSDLNLLASQVQEDLGSQVNIAPPLDRNWRSSE